MGSSGFGGLDLEQNDYASARVVVIPVPYDGTATYRTGLREGPGAILSASANMELFDEDLKWEPAEVGIATLDPVEPDARGPERMVAAIYQRCSIPAGDGKFIVGLGGEHTVTLGLLRPHAEANPDKLSVLQIDAHADLRNTYQESKFSHACVMRRALELCPIVGVGIRSFCREEYKFMQESGLQPFTMEKIRGRDGWVEEIVERLGENVYVTVDLDGLDPSICPGVGTPEPGGLDWYQVNRLLKEVFKKRHVVGADVVECLPLPGQCQTEFLAARLVYKMIGYRFTGETLK
jgi:agmatinase